MPAGESPAHLELKRLSLIWAQANGYSIAAREVSLPNLRFRLDVAAYRPGSVRVLKFDARRGVHRSVTTPALGLSAIFECKASRADLVPGLSELRRLIDRMKDLTVLRAELEVHLKLNCPSLMKGDSLWPEYETAAFERSDHPPYRKVVRALATLSRQLHGQTKMENLFKWNAANLHYLVVEPELVAEHEIPSAGVCWFATGQDWICASVRNSRRSRRKPNSLPPPRRRRWHQGHQQGGRCRLHGHRCRAPWYRPTGFCGNRPLLKAYSDGNAYLLKVAAMSLHRLAAGGPLHAPRPAQIGVPGIQRRSL